MNARVRERDLRVPETAVSDPRHLFHALLAQAESPATRAMARKVVSQEIATARSWRIAGEQERTQAPGSLQDMLDVSRAVRDQRAASVSGWTDKLDARGWKLVLRQYAPIAMTEGSWIQYAFGPLRSHTASSAALLRAHSLYAGYGSATGNSGHRYLESLHGLDIALPAVGTWAFANDDRIATAVWREPAVALALSEFSETFLPEILGYNLFRAMYGLCPLVAAASAFVREQGAAIGYWEFHRSDAIRIQLVDGATAAIQAYLEADTGDSGLHETERSAIDRIGTGLALAEMLTGHWLAVAGGLVDRDGLSPRAQMLALVERKALHAFGYHRHPRLRGHPVDEYLDPAQTDAETLLGELARSPYVKPGESGRSPLLTKLVQFGGPMFRIFTPAELDTIAVWIDSLPKADALTPEVRKDAAGDTPACVPEIGPVIAPVDIGQHDMTRPAVQRSAGRRYNVRELYHRLLNVEAYPDALEAGAQFASEWIIRSGLGTGSDDRGLPFESYSATMLKSWLDAKHREQVDSYDADSSAMMQSREAVIHQSVQLCPMVFIDGAWLQRFSSVVSCGTTIGSLLYHIYADELGNGSVRENHPNVYRELMLQMGVELPEFTTREFAFWSGFEDEAFDVPTFWLSVSRFPQRFFPEILGLNLAMELSGVGGSYRQGRDLLRKYGYSSAFVDLHNTIDNVSTGHTAMALQAITLHLDAVASHSAGRAVDREWHRVWTGYRALKPPTGIRGKLRLARHRAAALLARRSQLA
ncbi:iron-containing redox enzyme family protein [Burkholderia cepacia]|uniref:iron-containing redox enzyme family protein n=1 Tax=Burkholderia cepacia TaxID=292 RepID=UPI0015FA3A1E|nr:iron-containing redox enzyme family protein [Burkholderia cepacia]MBA9948198.1 iron-containing redox enzyme family protein [Burkholderia cepacia]MBA9978330.1 iron-containing redox enzyme family protein [Burkholderia cepacia]MBA9996317.1 iron-containing redox enzyme family protein [Burkholderia cepacia]MBB0004195.1 iron-containing redox enzyme family protein [Burkholderia cepacia]MBB0011909.1 iron-containing redox enzyme family protein [Burkholderia cepacia]